LSALVFIPDSSLWIINLVRRILKAVLNTLARAAALFLL